MDGEQTKTLSLKAAYEFGAKQGLEREISEIRDMPIDWDSSYTTSVRRGYIVTLLEKHNLFDEFKKLYWSFGNTPSGETLRRRFLRIKDQYEDFLAGRSSEPGEDELAEETVEFAVESHLRDFLARNLELVEPGLHLYESSERNGVEFVIDGGRIDLLAVDRDGKYVVIELKLSQGRNKALGQLLYYMGWVEQNLGKSPCRGYIIGSEICPELIVAASRVPGVIPAKYKMNFTIEPVAKTQN